MGLKSTANPGPLSFEQPNHADATPSVTPMRPTPLVGNWCDLPWGGEGEASPAQTPAGKKSLHDGVNFLVSHAPALMTNCSKAIAADPIATMLAPRTESSPDFLHQRENTMVPDEVAPHSDASSDGELLQDLYLATPAASLMPDDFETEEPVSPAPQDQPQPDSTAPVETQEDETVLAMPSRASHFVDFRRLPASQAQQFVRVQVGPNPTVPQQQPFQTYSHNVYAQRVPAAATYAAPATFQYSRHHVQMSMGHAYSASVAPIQAIPAPVVVQPAAVASAMGGLVHHGVHQRYTPVVETREKAQPAGLNLVLVSRFPPPPPPSLEHLHTMLRTGCSFESYYAIVMRWYKKVCATTPKAHPQVPMCPAAEHYLHDFEGWVREINMWWGKHFTRRSRGGNGARNGGRKDHQ